MAKKFKCISEWPELHSSDKILWILHLAAFIIIKRKLESYTAWIGKLESQSGHLKKARKARTTWKARNPEWIAKSLALFYFTYTALYHQFKSPPVSISLVTDMTTPIIDLVPS